MFLSIVCQNTVSAPSPLAQYGPPVCSIKKTHNFEAANVFLWPGTRLAHPVQWYNYCGPKASSFLRHNHIFDVLNRISDYNIRNIL